MCWFWFCMQYHTMKYPFWEGKIPTSNLLCVCVAVCLSACLCLSVSHAVGPGVVFSVLFIQFCSLNIVQVWSTDPMYLHSCYSEVSPRHADLISDHLWCSSHIGHDLLLFVNSVSLPCRNLYFMLYQQHRIQIYVTKIPLRSKWSPWVCTQSMMGWPDSDLQRLSESLI